MPKKTADQLSPQELKDIVTEFQGEPLKKILTAVAEVLEDFTSKHKRGPRTRLLILGQIVIATKSTVAQMYDEEMAAAMNKR